MLQRLYPADHPVLGLDGTTDTTVGALTAAVLATGTYVLPPVPDRLDAASPWGLPWLVARLRAPGGCPWDREQDHRSLRSFLLEEAYEVYDALEEAPGPALAEELGDLWLQIVLHAQHAAEAGIFDLTDVERSIMTKIIRRHPHVFGDGAARTAEEVTRAWEDIKADERAAAAAGGASGPTAGGGVSDVAATGATATPARARDADMPAAFAGLSRSLPALAYADEMQERAASLGYDWPDLEGVIDKVAEEATELLGAQDAAERTEEYGDLLFVLVNLGRKLDIDPEAALRAASRKFARRFAGVERLAAERQVQLKALGLDELDELWQEVKRAESETAMASGLVVPTLGIRSEDDRGGDRT
ncbi:MAG: nucleoside triphosphate pyrophosphohydrolase [Chloroflexi bacterium]|nr:nucleoside triphosphate pyrophosphohydrolase [Chloroflexota bacterium]